MTIAAPLSSGMETIDQAKQLRDKWADLLESDEHRQGSCVLKGMDGSHCCLGVAAEHVLMKEFKQRSPDLAEYYIGMDGQEKLAYLGQEDAEALGIAGSPTTEQWDAIGEVVDTTSLSGLSFQGIFSTLNDSLLLSFDEIAKVVRAID